MKILRNLKILIKQSNSISIYFISTRLLVCLFVFFLVHQKTVNELSN